MAKKTASASKPTGKCRNVSAFDILRSIEADFGKPQVKAIFPEAAKSLQKAKKIACAFIADLQAKAVARPNERYYVPVFAMKRGTFYFGDMIDGEISPFLSLQHEDAAHVFPMTPLTGITAREAADIFLHDEEEVLVPLTALAVSYPQVFDGVLKQLENYGIDVAVVLVEAVRHGLQYVAVDVEVTVVAD